MVSVRPGAILVALKANAWIVPVYVNGSPYNGTPWSPLFMRARSEVRVGEPIDVAPYVGRHRDSEVVKELLVRSIQEIAKLAGEDDFHPVLAGRRWKDDNVPNGESNARQDDTTKADSGHDDTVTE